MKWSEYHDILGAIEEQIKREKEYSEGFSKLNPSDRERREHERDMIITGLNRAMTEITFLYLNGTISIDK